MSNNTAQTQNQHLYFMGGLICGLILRYTDVLPIIGGFALGVAVKQLPDVINKDTIPNTFSKLSGNIYGYMNNFKGNEKKDV